MYASSTVYSPLPAAGTLAWDLIAVSGLAVVPQWVWGTNSVGRVRPLQGRSQGFESPVLHVGSPNPRVNRL